MYASHRTPWLRGLVLTIIALVVLAACGGDGGDGEVVGTDGAPATDRELQKFTFMLPGIFPMAFYAPRLADELGYFEAEGLDVRFEDGGGSSGAVQQLVAGNGDLAYPAASAFINAVAQDRDVRMVGQGQYKNIFNLVALEGSGISSVQDLQGKTVGVSDPAGGEVSLVRGVLSQVAGLEEGQDYAIQAVGEGSALTVEALRSGDVDAYSSNLWDIGAIELAGIDLVTILPEEAANFAGDVFVATGDDLEGQRDQIVGFLRAWAKGEVFARTNRDAAFSILSEAFPEEAENQEFARFILDTALDYLGIPPEEFQDQRFGAVYLPGLQNLKDFLATEGTEEQRALLENIDLSNSLDQTLLDAVNDFDRQAVVEEAQNWSP